MNKQISMTDFYDIYGTWHTPWWQTAFFYYSLLACGAFAILAIGYVIIKRHRAKKMILTSWDRALVQLKEVETQMHDVTRSGYLYARITTTLKRYLQERFGFDVVGMTDDELLAYLGDTEFPKDLLEDLRGVVKGGLTAKFANVVAVREQLERDIALSIMIIKKTIPREQ